VTDHHHEQGGRQQQSHRIPIGECADHRREEAAGHAEERDRYDDLGDRHVEIPRPALEKEGKAVRCHSQRSDLRQHADRQNVPTMIPGAGGFHRCLRSGMLLPITCFFCR
jgi:hypothetical protein